MDDYVADYLKETKLIADTISCTSIEKMVDIILAIKNNRGRLFFLGVGGGAGNASHAVNDFRKICGMECYAPTDNVSELTARVNDEGWDSVFIEWLRGSHFNSRDGIFIFSVGGGNLDKNISSNLVKALKYATDVGARILGIVGRDGGYTALVADACVIIPTVNKDAVTPHTEAFQSVIWHLIITHPSLKSAELKWESVK